MLRITRNLAIADDEIRLTYITASGPGGQNVNKVASAAQLRFDAARSPALSPGQLERLSKLAGRRMTRDGVVVITAQRYRSQEDNRRDALERLAALLRAAASPPPPRRPTRPPRAAAERRLDAKRQRATRKRERAGTPEE